MGKNNRIIVGCIVVLLGTSLPLFAKKTDTRTTEPSAAELLKTLKDLHEVLNSQLDDYVKQVDNLNQLLEQRNQESEIIKRERSIQTLTAKVDSMLRKEKVDSMESAELRASLETLRDSVSNVVRSDSSKIASLEAERSILQDSLLALRSELKEMGIYRKGFLIDKFNASKDYLSLPYSQMKEDDLNEFIANLSEYSADAEVKTKIEFLESAKRMKKEVEAMNEVLNKPYIRSKVIDASDKFKSLEKIKNQFSAAQWNEFRTLYVFITRYAPGLDAFKQIIKSINDELKARDYPNNKDFSDRFIKEVVVDMVLKKHEEVNINKYINVVPYLKMRFDSYINWAKTNPLSEKPEAIIIIEEEINNLKI